jgi:blue copper oxidase
MKRRSTDGSGSSVPEGAIDRRTVFAVFGGGALAGLIVGCSSDGRSTSTSAPAGGSNQPATSLPAASLPPVSAPPLETEVRDLRLRITAAPGTAEIVAGSTTDVLRFNVDVVDGDPASVVSSGSYLGPTLHLRQGQGVRVSFDNGLDQDSIVHWHGLVVPEDQDGQPTAAVGPGETYEYDFVVTNRPGTYWYHAHPHHHTGEQVYRGLAGLLIVHGDEPELPSGSDDLALVLQDRTIGSDGQLRYVGTRHDQMAGFVGETLVTNGVAGLELSVARRPHRIRLLNGANARTQHLQLSTGQDLLVVATDGHLLPEAVSVPALVLTPAQRSDLWIDFSSFEAGDRIDLLTADTFIEGPMGGGGMGGGGMGGGAAGELVLDHRVAATFVVADTPAEPGTAPGWLGGVVDVDPAAAVNTDSPRQFVLSTRRAAHWINGTQWEGRVASEEETVEFGTTELWDIVNTSPMAHPMHFHGEAFTVVERAWENDAAAGSWEAIAAGIVETGPRDTVLVWPGQRVRIAIAFTANRGYFTYHCHILEHEDGGMMRNFLVS